MTLLQLNQIGIRIMQRTSLLRYEPITLLNHINLSVDEGEIVALVGASGAGKSMLARAIMGLLPSSAKLTGLMTYRGEPLTAKRRAQLRGKEVIYVPQSTSSLDPLMRVGKQVRLNLDKSIAKLRQQEAFATLHLPPQTENKYPFECSGGMMRRILLSTAMVSEGKLIIADEPTPGLHQSLLNVYVEQMQRLVNAGCGLLFITHQIELAIAFAHKIAIIHDGTIVEVAKSADFHGEGQCLSHPYSKALWQALPSNQFRATWPEQNGSQKVNRSGYDAT